MKYRAGNLLVVSVIAFTLAISAVGRLSVVFGDDSASAKKPSVVDIEDYLAKPGGGEAVIVQVDFTANSESCAFVDTAGAEVVLPKQMLPGPVLVALQKPFPGSARLKLVLSPQLKDSLVDFSSSLSSFLEKAVRDEAKNPLACYDAALVGDRLRSPLSDLKPDDIDISQNRSKVPKVLVAGEALKDSGSTSIRVSRIVIIAPPVQQHAANYREGGGLKAMAIDVDGSKSGPSGIFVGSSVGENAAFPRRQVACSTRSSTSRFLA